MILQKKALDVSFNLTPWKWAWHYHEAATPSRPKRSQKPSAHPYAFRGERAWRPPEYATPLNFLSPKSLDQELSADVSFVSVLAMVLSEYWKRLEEIFRNKIISAISQNGENYKNISSSLFQYSERTNDSTETNNTSAESSWSKLFENRKFRGVALLGGRHALLPRKHILLNFTGARRVFDFLPSMRPLGHYF